MVDTTKQRQRHRSGSQRERSPGVWEIRIPIEPDPNTGRYRQLSMTVHGTGADAAAQRALLIAQQANTPGLPPPSRMTLAHLLPVWLAADHPWKPSTLVGYRSVVRALLSDPIAATPIPTLTPQILRAAIGRWQLAGASLAVVGGRVRVLRAALSWAWSEQLLTVNPLRGFRGPARPDPRRPVSDSGVGTLLAAAEMRLLEAHANQAPAGAASTWIGRGGGIGFLHRAEQDLLLVRLAADTGARRGELVALRLDDLDGRTLRIVRAVSAGELTTPKSGRGRTLTLGTTTARLWHDLADTWADRSAMAGPGESSDVEFGPWVFTSDLAHHHRLGAEILGHRFARLRDDAGVPDATLHRLRHTVATLLVRQGRILDAQHRLGHADAATTLREYSHVLPGTDTDVADDLDTYLDHCRLDVDNPDRRTLVEDEAPPGRSARRVTTRLSGTRLPPR